MTEEDRNLTEKTGLSRRDFLKIGSVTGGVLPLASQAVAGSHKLNHAGHLGLDLAEKTIVELQAMMTDGELTSVQLTEFYLRRIRVVDGHLGLNIVITTNPAALAIAAQLDLERETRGPRGPLHGMPIMLKDNIDTGDAMMTTAGSLALVGEPAAQDATVVQRLRSAGAVILGKTNLSEWANFRGFGSSSGWSGVGEQCRSPYVLDRNPCGSSSGSGAAVTAGLCAAALGTETDGSVVCPAAANGVVGIKPTVGLTSRAGVVPISATQDTVGIHGRTVADAAALLGSMTGVDPRDAATDASAGMSHSDYTQYVDTHGLAGARIGVARQFGTGTTETGAVFESALQSMQAGGATLVDITLPSFDAFANDISEVVVLVYEFKRDLNAYLATRSGVPVGSMADCIAFNVANAEEELKWFGQEWMELAEVELFSADEYAVALDTGRRLAAEEGIDAVLNDFNVDAIVAPTNTPAWPNDLIAGDCFQFGSSAYCAVAGYPILTVPMGDVFGLPVGMSLMGTAWSEPTLIKLAAGFEAVRQARISPNFVRTLPVSDRLIPFKNRAKPLDRDRLMATLANYRRPQLPRAFFL